MKAELDEYGVTVVALSKDTVQEAAIHKERDGISIQLLSDENLKVIRQYGVEHHKAFGFTTDTLTVFGIPLSPNPSFKEMAIPTTLIIDEQGIIRWIDQADDYRIRSDSERVMAAVKNLFG